MGSKQDSYYLNKALTDINAIIRYTRNLSYDEFVSDEKTIDSVMFRLIQLIENIKNISDNFKQDHLEVPWGKIIGFRNGIVHEYGSTDYSTVYEIISKNIYELKDLFEANL